MKRQYWLLLILSACFITFDACHTSERIMLTPAANIVVSGRNITLQYNASSQANGFSIIISGVGSATCSNISIETTSAYGFVPNKATFLPSPENSSMPQYSCMKSGSNIILTEAPPLSQKGFRPWVDDFTITIGQTVFTVTVNSTLTASQTLTRGSQSVMNLNSNFPGCGLVGTVLQRAYDCSKMITNYGATVTGDAGTLGTNAACAAADPNPSCQYYTPFTNPNTQDATLFWFVVSCPAGATSSAVPQQNCSWLTPVVASNQPALDTGGTETFTLNLLTGYQKRLLLSGKMTDNGNGYTFANANGYPPTSQTEGAYTFVTPPSSAAANPGAGAIAPPPTPSPTTVCLATSGQALHSSGTFPATDAAIRNLISSSTGATISWQVPSYPMLIVITGGTNTEGSAACKAHNSGDRPICDEPKTPGSNMGFNALNVPGFSESYDGSVTEYLWTSSTTNMSGQAWTFVPNGFAQDGGVASDDGTTTLTGVRCVSLAWY